ncbi:MAG TPA: GGDEF domain-containing protein, partial [Bryobacteraceae bacterium]|nr:GGDEF domain-containing protein [Bryobacteraceae bacterium]
MISLKKHIESPAVELAKTAVRGYPVILASIAKAGAQAVPHLAGDLQHKLTVLHENLSADTTPGEIVELQQGVVRELSEWGESAAKHARDHAKEVREIMVAVTAAAAAVGERDQRYSTQFGGMTQKLNAIARLEDVSSLRRSVLQCASELKTAIRKMAEEGEQSLSQLRAEVANYRVRLAQSQEREAADPLTGLANRREIEAQIEERIAWKGVFSLAFLDLNGFKRINDVHGHVAGDDLLKQFATELKAPIRANDLVGRWGGDEFVVIVDGSLEEAQVRLDRIRQWAFGEY